MSALPALIDVGVGESSALVEAGRIDPSTEHVLCHYSAEHFRAELFARLREAGHAPDDERWFTNLHTAGNTGAASIFVMLDASRPRLRRGDRVLLVVPESGRFSLAFAHLTCVGPEGGPSPAELSASPLGHPDVPVVPAPIRLSGCGQPVDQALHRGDEPAELLRAQLGPAGPRRGRPAANHAGGPGRPGTGSLPVRVDSNVDVRVMVYEHAVRCEYAHARLCQRRDAAVREVQAMTRGAAASGSRPGRPKATAGGGGRGQAHARA
jgi:hypothetical protein